MDIKRLFSNLLHIPHRTAHNINRNLYKLPLIFPLLLRIRQAKLRRDQTRYETIMMSILYNLKKPFVFQEIISPYIVDFLLPADKIILEIDGNAHDNRGEYDDRRSRYLLSKGYEVYRVANDDVHINIISKLLHAIT